MSIKKNFLYNSAYQVLLIILPLITAPYIARVIGPDGIGVYSYTYSIANYFVIVAMLGINNYGNRSIASVREDKEKLSYTFSSILIFHILISVAITMLYVIYVYIFVENNKTIFIIQFLFVLSSVFDINWFFFGMEQFKLTVIRNTFIKLITVLSIFIFIRKSEDLFIYTLIMALGTLISQILLWPFLKNYISLKRVRLKDVFKHFKPCLVLFVPVIAISIYKIMDKIMLGNLSTMVEVGYFENAEKLNNIPLGIVTALGTVMLPKMSNLVAKGNKLESINYIKRSIQFAMFIAIGSAIGLIGIANTFVPIFLGDKFIPVIPVIYVISPSILFLAWANVIRTQYLIPNNKDKIFMVSTIVGAIINLVLNLIFITKLGALGAAIGTLFAEASVAIYQTLMVKKYLSINQYIKSIVPFILPSMVMYILIKFIEVRLGRDIFSLIIQILIGGGVYCILSFIHMYLRKDEIVVNILQKYKRR